MAEIFSTVGLVIDVIAVLTLIILSHAESGMPPTLGVKGILPGLKLRAKTMWLGRKNLLFLNALCVIGLFIGTTLMILGIWMRDCG